MAKHEVLCHDAMARTKRNIHWSKQLSLAPDNETTVAREKRTKLKAAIETNVERILDDWKSYIEHWKEAIASRTKCPARSGTFTTFSEPVCPRLEDRELQRCDKILGTLEDLRTASRRQITTRAQLAIINRGRRSDYTTLRERAEV